MIEIVEQVTLVVCAHGYAMRRYRHRLIWMPSLGRHFQGGTDYGRVPGLKAWAVLSDHFMVKSRHQCAYS
jgi:hypothetical protein